MSPSIVIGKAGFFSPFQVSSFEINGVCPFQQVLSIGVIFRKVAGYIRSFRGSC